MVKKMLTASLVSHCAPQKSEIKTDNNKTENVRKGKI